MGKPKRFGDVEIEFDLKHERREWRVQRVAWALMALIVCAALLGLLGPGPLSRATVATQDAKLRVEFLRYARYEAPTELRIHCQPSADEFSLTLDRRFLEHAQIEEISPEPVKMVAAGERYTYMFNREAAGDQLVTIRFRAEQFGSADSQVVLDSGPAVRVKQFYWP